MKKLGKNGWGLEDMIGFLVAFAVILIVIFILYHQIVK
jgi:hypothetical protein